MIQLYIDQNIYHTEATTLAALAAELQLPDVAMAAVVNQTVIGKSMWATTPLEPQCQLSFFQLVAGG